MLSETVGSIAADELRRYEGEMLRNYRNELSQCVPSNVKTMWYGILSGVVSTLLFSVIAGLFYFIGETSDRSTRLQTKELMENVRHSVGDSIVAE